MAFCTTMCSKGAGILKSRDAPLQYNTDSEKLLFNHTTEHEFYRHLGNSALKSGITIDLYFGVQQATESIDLASINHLV